jgi:thioesterase domain-containing protein
MEELFYHCKDMSLLPEPWTHLTPARMQRLLVHLVDLERSPYLFSLLPMDVHMFVAKDAQGAADLPADFLDLVPGTRLKILQVPGNHDTMVQSANARWLGAALSQAIKEDSKTKSSTSGLSSPVRLSNMQSGTPVFCVPGVGMHANSFVGLVSAFRFSRPAYAFEPRGRKEGDIPHTTIESAARFYLKELETAYPSGPVHLLGHARGGWVAFEMALMLQSSGRDVLSLTLLDTDSPDESSRDLREYTLREVVGNLLEYARLALHRSVISLAELAQEPAPRQREILLDLLIQSGMLPAKAENADLYYALQIIGTGLRTRYIPHRTFSGSLHFIHAAESTGAEENQDSQKAISRWERWASSVTLHRSPGNSITMLHSPHLKSLAEIVEDEMNRSSGNVLSQSAACT